MKNAYTHDRNARSHFFSCGSYITTFGKSLKKIRTHLVNVRSQSVELYAAQPNVWAQLEKSHTHRTNEWVQLASVTAVFEKNWAHVTRYNKDCLNISYCY